MPTTGDQDDRSGSDGSAVLGPEALARLDAQLAETYVVLPVPGSVTGAMTALYSDGTVVRRWRPAPGQLL